MRQEIESRMKEYEQLFGSKRPLAQQAPGVEELRAANIAIAVSELKVNFAEIDREKRLFTWLEIAIEPMAPEKNSYPKLALNIVDAGITSIILGVLLAL